MGDKITVPWVRARKGGPKLTMVTAYDYPSARVASQAGVEIILVGDSAANVIHGMDDTLGMTIDIMILHAQAVARAKPDSLLVVDMPWLSYHISIEDTLRNAGRLVQEGHAEAVKLEGGTRRLPMIEAIVGAEIPVLGHLGLTPQSVHAMGGYKVQGRELETARMLVQEAKELESAGVFAIVLEGIPDLVARASRSKCRCRPSGSVPGHTRMGRCWSTPICSGWGSVTTQSSCAATRTSPNGP